VREEHVFEDELAVRICVLVRDERRGLQDRMGRAYRTCVFEDDVGHAGRVPSEELRIQQDPARMLNLELRLEILFCKWLLERYAADT
jgi:hypothetical protein